MHSNILEIFGAIPLRTANLNAVLAGYKIKVRKIFAHFFALLFLCLCSCESPPECDSSLSYPYWTKWSDSELVSIVNDSLALLAIYKYKKECTSAKDNVETTESSSAGLFLVNYRVKQKPLLWDTLELRNNVDYSLRVYAGDFRDSSALVFDLFNDRFGFWKMGEKTIRFMDHDKSSDMMQSIKNVSHWANENMMLQIYNHPFILNAKRGQIKALGYEEYEWMAIDKQNNSCSGNFLSYVDGKIICIRSNTEASPPYSELVVDGIATNAIEALHSSYLWFGNYIVQNHDGKILKIDVKNFKFDKTFELRIDKYYNNPRFYKNNNDFISYSWWDLIN
jgi:hypothetical protein